MAPENLCGDEIHAMGSGLGLEPRGVQVLSWGCRLRGPPCEALDGPLPALCFYCLSCMSSACRHTTKHLSFTEEELVFGYDSVGPMFAIANHLLCDMNLGSVKSHLGEMSLYYNLCIMHFRPHHLFGDLFLLPVRISLKSGPH